MIDEIRKENIKKIESAIVLNASVQLKINVFTETKPYYFRGCILEYNPSREYLWLWDVIAGLKKFHIMDITGVKIILEKIYSSSQIQLWRDKIPRS